LVINRPPPTQVPGADPSAENYKPAVDEAFMKDFLNKPKTGILAEVNAQIQKENTDRKAQKLANAKANEKQGALFNVDACSQISSVL
jgi:hypothetical protein